MKTRKFPSFQNYTMALDEKVAKIRRKGDTNKNIAKSFDFWIQLSTLEKAKKNILPLLSNEYERSKTGNLKKVRSD